MIDYVTFFLKNQMKDCCLHYMLGYFLHCEKNPEIYCFYYSQSNNAHMCIRVFTIFILINALAGIRVFTIFSLINTLAGIRVFTQGAGCEAC